MKYLVFKSDGTYSVVETSGVMPLEQMQKIVGGYVEHTRHGIFLDGEPVNLDLFVNEEGWVMEPPLPENPFFPRLAGNAIAGHIDDVGEFQGVSDSEIPAMGSRVGVLVLARDSR